MTQNRSTLAGLSPEKRALLEMRLLKKSVPPPREASARKSRPDELRPVSHAQESLWFLDQLEPNSPLYNIPQAIRLRGALDIPALQKALATIVDRHEALRTVFESVEGKPMQRVQTKQDFTFYVSDLSRFDGAVGELEAQRQIDAEFRRPFNLAGDLLLRATLLKLSEPEHLLLLTAHHIVSDLASFLVLHEEIAALYEAFSDGKPSPLPELPVQFPDFAACQRARLHGPALAKQLAFWKEQFTGELPVLELPTDQPRSATPTFRGARRNMHFSSLLLGQLKEMSRESGATLYMTLLASFGVLLHRYSSQNEIVIGSPISGRNSADAEKLIGFLINTLPMCLNFSGDPSFDTLLERVRDFSLNALANQEMPVEKLVEELRMPRHSGRNPLFSVVFQFLSVPPQPLKMRGLQTDLLDVETGTAKFDLTLTLAETADGLDGNIEFNTDLFEPATIDRMIGHLQALLESVAWNPEGKIEKLTLLQTSERQQLLIDWNKTQSAYPRQASIHELFQQQAKETPDAVAVVCADQQLTYRELDQRSAQLAHHLRKLGVGPDVLAGFCVERSLEMIVGLLGILKAGGAYVTIDPGYPRERLAFMFQDTAMPVFVTQAKFKNLASEKAKVVCLDEDAAAISLHENVNASLAVTAENLAYVIYTSGSTGQPKGVSIPHRGVVRLVKETNYLRFTSDDVFLQFAPISFDASTLEIWGPLLNGGRLVLFPAVFESLEQLGEIIQRHKITTLWLTAGLFHQMVEHQVESLRGVRQLLAGGDVLSVPHVLKALRELPNTEITNGYGPTENTTFTCCYKVPRTWTGERSVPIGKPINQTQVYILDKWMQPVPIGVAGELFIGGDGLAREYLNAPELTAQKFVRAPFARLYKTGDLARWLPDGNIEFLGRLDFQVKIRGFRVELGEIETAIAQHPAVRENIVIAREDKSATKHLAAYIVPRRSGRESAHSSETDRGCVGVGDQPQRAEIIVSAAADAPTPHTAAVLGLTAADLRRFLEEKLPAHMVPSAFVFIKSLPLNANGKVDRKQLPEPSEKYEVVNDSAAPRTPAQETLTQIWCEVLGVKHVGLQDDFFELGGHSLLATRLVSRVSKAFNVQFPLRAVFETPTIFSQAEAVTKLPPSQTSDAPIARRSRQPVSAQPMPVGAEEPSKFAPANSV